MRRAIRHRARTPPRRSREEATMTTMRFPTRRVLTRIAIAASLALSLAAPALSHAQAARVAIEPAVAARDHRAAHVQAVATVGMTVSDVDRAAEFFRTVLSFEKVSDV